MLKISTILTIHQMASDAIKELLSSHPIFLCRPA